MITFVNMQLFLIRDEERVIYIYFFMGVWQPISPKINMIKRPANILVHYYHNSTPLFD